MSTGTDPLPPVEVEEPGSPALPPEHGARRRLTWWAGIALPIFLLAGVAFYGTGYGYAPPPAAAPIIPGSDIPADPAALKKHLQGLRSEERKLRGALLKASPRGLYIVIDQTQNRIYLKKDDQVLQTAVCSAGSGMVLQEETGRKRQWVFDTPRGLFRVLTKVEDPVWKKPDWAFVEEGKPIPKDPSERFEYGTLGEYALYFGNGYLIHGTLYERLLGRSVTHGCIRVGRDDLRKLYASVPLGTPIYIY